MNYKKLGNTDLKVSTICLGTMTWGEQNSQDEGFHQMDYAIDQGVNFWDTAELYSIPPKEETQGSTERIIGSWFEKKGCRQEIILATKVAGRSGMKWFRGGETRLNKENIEKAIEGSLKRLKTDYIDLYQLHWPDRALNIFGGGLGLYKHYDLESVPIEESLDVLNQIVETGKVRHIGLSNETPWGTMKYLELSETKSLPRVASIQNAYNLVNRGFEIGLSEIAMQEQVGLLAYSPLAQGIATGKFHNKPELMNKIHRWRKMKFKKRNPVVKALLKFKNKIIEHKKIYKRNKQRIKQQMLSHSQDI